ncbi:UNKNOWN [Stylonychia lemnae]|uniref:Uncharacterized protein n=1 Tax=Stylonychia lemnae TaxID=5949 RepID=A0A077ZZX2_STYLE|nr:UNKNOWN [Stylonychia lemnae]|eukprot:CDW74753.1 UNKNOWN [Stylonychia lemnae]
MKIYSKKILINLSLVTKSQVQKSKNQKFESNEDFYQELKDSSNSEVLQSGPLQEQSTRSETLKMHTDDGQGFLKLFKEGDSNYKLKLRSVTKF